MKAENRRTMVDGEFYFLSKVLGFEAADQGIEVCILTWFLSLTFLNYFFLVYIVVNTDPRHPDPFWCLHRCVPEKIEGHYCNNMSSLAITKQLELNILFIPQCKSLPSLLRSVASMVIKRQKSPHQHCLLCIRTCNFPYTLLNLCLIQSFKYDRYPLVVSLN